MTRPVDARRRESPPRLLAAGALLVLSLAAVLAALVDGTATGWAVAALVTLACSLGVAWLGHAVLVEERRAHAADRAAQARAFRSLLVERSAEQTLFAARQRDRLLAADRFAGELRTLLRLAETRADDAARRAEALERTLVRREAESAGPAEAREPAELSAWDTDGGAAEAEVVDLLAWEERTAPRMVRQRRHA